MPDPKNAFLQKLMTTFRAEAEEHLQDIITQIVQMERAGPDASQELVERILKRLHTLKGAARAVDLSELELLCHAMENVFSTVLGGQFRLAADQFDLLHQSCTLAGSLANENGGRARNLATALAARLNALSTQPAEQAPAAPGPAAEKTTPFASNPEREHEGLAVDAPEPVRDDVVRVEGRNLDVIRYQTEALLSVELALQHHIADLLALADDIADRHIRMHAADPVPKRAARRTARSVEAVSDSKDFERQCRRLAGMLGRTQRDFSAIRSRLLAATLETALVPCAAALDQLPGLVRNLARSRGKQVVLDTRGGGTRVDRRILDTVREVMVHLAANAVDHGIESAERRRTLGKPAAGTILVEAKQCSGNRVSFILSDDGAGIDVDAIGTAGARHTGVDAEQLAAMNDRQKLQLALHAGVSTSSEVTQVSGRGMGLAIVAERVASIDGELLIDNRPGQGCSFELRLPVSLATLRGLVVRCGTRLFVLPLSGIESVCALKDGAIRTVENRETLATRDALLSVVRLGELLGIDRGAGAGDADASTAVIARAGGSRFALLVDEILSEQEVLPKTLGKQLRRVRCITGATQLGDGSLVPILGLDDLARYGLAAGRGMAAPRDEAGRERVAKRILVVEDSITSRLLLKHILEGAGYQVQTAVDGLEALSKLRQEEVDAVVSDIEMPQMDGLELTSRIRANPKTEELPVILVTSLQSAEERERGLRAGADAYVAKGAFDQDNLLTTIRRLV